MFSARNIKFILSALCTLLWTSGESTAQNFKERMNWFFGNKAGLDFSSSPPLSLSSSQMLQYEDCAVGNDSNGVFHFYTDGSTVWNKNHTVMAGGNGLSGNTGYTQPVIVVPNPLFNGIYYIFTSGAGAFAYSEVNMNLNAGLGTVTQKNNILFSSGLSGIGKLAAVQHANGKDVWVLCHERGNNRYRAYLVTGSGVSTSSVVSILGPTYSSSYKGGMQFSYNGKQLANAYYEISSVEICDFDNATGILSNSRLISTLQYPRSVAFSPNSRYLYVSSTTSNLIQQLDVLAGSITDIAASAKNIGTNYSTYGMQMGPDRKIYVIADYTNKLSVINNPDRAVPDCNYADRSISLRPSGLTRGLPNFVSRSIPEALQIIVSGSCVKDSVHFSFYPEKADSVSWDFDDPASGGDNQSNTLKAFHRYNSPGYYRIKLKRYVGGAEDTVSELLQVFGPKTTLNLGNDTSICSGSAKILLDTKLSGPEYTFQWSTGSVFSFIQANNSGTYWVKVFDGHCNLNDSISVWYGSAGFTVNLGVDDTICEKDSIVLDATVPGATYEWWNGSTSAVQVAKQSNIYWVKVNKPGEKCPAIDSVSIVVYPRPYLNLGTDKSICQDDSLVLNMSAALAKKYLWQDGTAGPLYVAKKAGTYILEIWNELCPNWDTLMLSVVSKESINLGADTSLCQGDSLQLIAGSVGTAFLWQDGSGALSYTVKKAGLYWVKTVGSCEAGDSIQVKILNGPEFDLGDDQAICPGEKIVLQPPVNGDFLWQNGSNAAIFEVTEPGSYAVKVKDACGEKSDSIFISDCACQIYVPTAFSPNEDKLNEVFQVQGCEPNYYRLEIFSKWGELLFKTNDFKQAWPGIYKGFPLPSDVYVWQITYSNNARDQSPNIVMVGTVNILR